jgi:HEAT repeat protein
MRPTYQKPRQLNPPLFIHLLIAFFTIANPLQGGEPDRILYLLKAGNINGAFDLYEQYRNESKEHNLELIQNMGLALLEQGYRSRIPEAQVLTLFGAGISVNERAMYILEEGIKSGNPQFQIVAINLLSRFQNDQATEYINNAMSSNFLPIRLEAVYQLAKNKNSKAPGQIEALMQKVPSDVLQVFPQLLAMCGDKNSIKSMRRLFTHPNEKVRIETILAAAKFHRDDLLPEIRKLSSHLNVAQQEACAVTLGVLKDESSSQRLYELAKSPTKTVRIAALQALYQLGREEVSIDIEKIAKEEDLFAITVLGTIPGTEPTLLELTKSQNLNVRINASLALLKLHDPGCLRTLPEILIKDKRDFAFSKVISLGKGLNAWKAVPSARQNFSSNAVGLEMSLHMREEALAGAIELPENAFLALANLIFETNQNELVPILSRLLINLQSTNAIQLLKYHREKIGAPLIRNYCNLALYSLKESGPYSETLERWVTSHHSHGLIQFRPLIPLELRVQEASKYQLMPEDASRLLVESFEALVQTQDEKSIDILLNAIRYGNNNNRYALAGLLMRAAH